MEKVIPFPATLRQRRCTHSMGTQGVSRPGYPSHRRTKQKDFGVLTSEGSRALMRLFSSPYPHTRLKLFLSKLRKLLSSLFSFLSSTQLPLSTSPKRKPLTSGSFGDIPSRGFTPPRTKTRHWLTNRQTVSFFSWLFCFKLLLLINSHLANIALLFTYANISLRFRTHQRKKKPVDEPAGEKTSHTKPAFPRPVRPPDTLFVQSSRRTAVPLQVTISMLPDCPTVS